MQKEYVQAYRRHNLAVRIAAKLSLKSGMTYAVILNSFDGEFHILHEQCQILLSPAFCEVCAIVSNHQPH